MPRGCYRSWIFTKFNGAPAFDETTMSFLVFQEEECPTTGRRHFQGYVEFKGQHSHRRSAHILLMPQSDGLAPRHGTQKQAIAYCTKLETRVEGTEPQYFGKAGGQGNRSDLDSIWQAMASGLNTREILFEFEGHALRHVHMISTGLRAVHHMDPVDRAIDKLRDADERLQRQGEIVGPSFPEWRTIAADNEVLFAPAPTMLMESPDPEDDEELTPIPGLPSTRSARRAHFAALRGE